MNRAEWKRLSHSYRLVRSMAGAREADEWLRTRHPYGIITIDQHLKMLENAWDTGKNIPKGKTQSSRSVSRNEVTPMDKASEAIFSLKPVIFRHKHELEPKGISQFGLMAEDVENVNPDLVSRDAEGNVLRYATRQ